MKRLDKKIQKELENFIGTTFDSHESVIAWLESAFRRIASKESDFCGCINPTWHIVEVKTCDKCLRETI